MNEVFDSVVPIYDMASGLLAGQSHEEGAHLVHRPTALPRCFAGQILPRACGETPRSR